MSLQDDIVRNQMLSQSAGAGGDNELFGGLLKGTRGLLDDVAGWWEKMITAISGIWGNGREKIAGFFSNLHSQLKQIGDSSEQEAAQKRQSISHQSALPSMSAPMETPDHGLGAKSWTDSVGQGR